MAQTYLLFDFGADEEKLQQARHKLDGWKQAFRLDKKLQFKFDRGKAPAETSQSAAKPEAEPKSPAKAKSKAKSSASSKSADSSAEKNGDVKLLVRLYFSPHEKLSEQRWVTRIPSEEPFKGASPRIVQEGTPEFTDVLNRFDTLD